MTAFHRAGRGLRLLTSFFPLLFAVPLFLGGCAPLSQSGSAPKQTLFFPHPPDPPKIQYLGSISSARDLPVGSGGFRDFLLGPPDRRSGLLKPSAAVLEGSRLYVCDTKLNTVLVFNLSTGEVRRLRGDQGNGKIQQPNNIAVDDEGRLYVADKLRGAVLVYGRDELFQNAWGRPKEVAPVDVAVGEKVLYVCDIKDHEIEVWDRFTGEFMRSMGEKGFEPGQFGSPTNLALDADGNLFVSDTANFRVQKISPVGKPLRVYGGAGVAPSTPGSFAWPKGVDVDGRGRLYVADSRYANVQIFDAEGRLLLFFGGPGEEMGNLDLPAGVSVTPWPSLRWLNRRLAPGFDPEYLVIVVNQWQGSFVNFFAVARDKAVAP